jgi:heparan-alpha-glucosaminide N-acetyltransferase
MAVKIVETTENTATEQRLLSLDAYRGLIMIALAFNGFGLARTAANHLAQNPESTFWRQVQFQFSHVEWQGCAFWDLIQPSFMFMVGVSMAYSYVKRQARGDAYAALLAHALWRSVILVLLGVFLSSTGSDTTRTNWVFMNVLSQIGLGYPFLFLMWRKPVLVQFLTVGLLLGATWLMYTRFPAAGIDMTDGNPAVGVSAEWAQEHLAGVAPAWHKNANIGHALDQRLLNWLPRTKPFEYNSGGYQTLNFIPSLATMLLGLICGEWLRQPWSGRRKLLLLAALGCGGIVAGLVWEANGCALVKRIWTPSWALFATGICCLILAALYGIIDVAGWRRWSYVLVVVGMNSIAIYMMGQLLRGWTAGRLQVHLGQPLLDLFGSGLAERWALYMPLITDTSVGIAFWLACLWMARQRIFVRV